MGGMKGDVELPKFAVSSPFSPFHRRGGDEEGVSPSLQEMESPPCLFPPQEVGRVSRGQERSGLKKFLPLFPLL